MNQDQNNDLIRNNDINTNENPRSTIEDIAMASVLLPLAHANLLDYLYASGIPLRPIQLGGAGVGGVDVDINGIASILANSLYDIRTVKNVIDEKGMSEISEKTYTKHLAEELKINTVCGIWQDDFEEGELIKVLPCNHAFKSEAIEKWLTTEKAECPICRFSLSSKEVVCRPLSYDDADADDEGVRESNDDTIGNSSDNGSQAQVIVNEPVQQNVSQINENNIASRLVNNIQNRLHRNDPLRAAYAGAYASRQSISTPISQLIQNRRNMVENIARASGSTRTIPRLPVQTPPQSTSAEPRHWFGGGFLSRSYQFPEQPDVAYNYNVTNNTINNYYNNDHISNQERDDIQEAIRRSLEEQ